MSEKPTDEPCEALPPAPPDARRPYQFTLGWLFAVTTVTALALSLCAAIGWNTGLGLVISVAFYIALGAVLRRVFCRPPQLSQDEEPTEADDSSPSHSTP